MTVGEFLLMIAAFVSGALPFSVWIGRVALRKDIRAYGDGNPGMFNVLRAGGGLSWGGLVLALEISKAAVPVGLAAQVFEINGLPLVLIAIAPPLGHAFSPFLRLRGGKAIASIFGVWIGLTIWSVPLLGMILLVFWYLVLTSSGWAIALTMLGILAYLLMAAAESALLVIWALLMALIVFKHRAELTQLPAFRLPPPLRPLFNRPSESDSHAGDSVHNGSPDRN
jgi:acyl phosphate:glycerol-3-phosphate acyltransferase